jgi:hypothetical protein
MIYLGDGKRQTSVVTWFGQKRPKLTPKRLNMYKKNIDLVFLK